MDIIIKISDFFARFNLTQDQLVKGAFVVLTLLGFLIGHFVIALQKKQMRLFKADNRPGYLVPGALRPHHLVFTLNTVEYDGKALQYLEISAVNFYSVITYVKGNPSTGYDIDIKAATGRIKISFNNLIMNDTELAPLYDNIVNDLKTRVLPVFMKKTVNDIFTKGKLLKVGDLWLDKDGYSHKKHFSNRVREPWTAGLFQVEAKGTKYLIKNPDNSKVLASINFETPNAAILETMAGMCYERFTKKEGF